VSPRAPGTAAVRVLRAYGVAYTEHAYRYEDHGGTAISARALGVDEHAIVKTLVLQDEAGRPLLMLMHGDREVSLKALARQAGRRLLVLCDPATASRHSGYRVGGTSPFGTRRPMPLFAERTIEALPRIYINGGRRGFLVSLETGVLTRLLDVQWVDAAIEP
jgi:Cys-tRNA(Pro) deacylase